MFKPVSKLITRTMVALLFLVTTFYFCLYLGNGESELPMLLLWSTAYVTGWCFFLAALQWFRDYLRA